MTAPSQTPEAAGLEPCPFCGGKASVSTYETESLWSHDIVTYTRVGCDECDISFSTEPGYDLEAPEAWNRRAIAASAQAAIDAEKARADRLAKALDRLRSILAKTPMPDCPTLTQLLAADAEARAALQQETQP